MVFYSIFASFLGEFSLIMVFNHILFILISQYWFFGHAFHILPSMDYQSYLYYVSNSTTPTSHASIAPMDLL